MTKLYIISIVRSPVNSPVVCTCNNPVMSDINVTFTSTSLTITQTGDVPNLTMLNILRHHILFVHSTVKHSSTYTAVIAVTVSDGIWSSIPVYSIVSVERPVVDVSYI